MPIIQISQIKHRRGLRNDLPKPSLEEGEIGLALDTGELFIGTPNLPEAIARNNRNEFPFANTQILTEWSDNVKNLLRYKYLDREIEFFPLSAEFVTTSAIAWPVLEYQTSTSAKSITVVRKLQEKLDEYVSVKDYGAVGDGIYDSLIISPNFDSSKIPSNNKMNAETAALRRAILDVANKNNLKDKRYGFRPRKLFFPAGIYHINDTLPIPPYSHWVGEGKNHTIIAMSSALTATVSAISQFECLAFTVDGELNSENPFSSTEYLNHSYQNIAVSSLPEFIIIEGITFLINFNSIFNSKFMDVLRFIAAKNVYLKNCRIIGNWSVPYIGTPSTGGLEWKSNTNSDFYHHDKDTICLVFDSFGKMDERYKPRNIVIENCEIGNSVYGCILTDDVKNIYFHNNVFNRLYRGISLNETLPVSIGSVFDTITRGLYGPQNIVSNKNVFRNIKREGEANFSPSIIVSSNTNEQDYSISYMISMFNHFENVGYNNTNNGDEYYSGIITATIPVTPAVNFNESIKNISFGDYFERTFEENKVSTIVIGDKNTSRVYAKNRRKNIIVNSFDVDGIQREIILLSGVTTFTNTGLRFNYDGNIAYMNYSINVSAGGNSIQRYGTAEIVINENSVSFNEEYTETGGITGIELSAFPGNPVTIRYKNNNSQNATMKFEIKWYKN